MAGRPRKFTLECVLDTVITLFQNKGYEATSMTDIAKATGLHKGSLYQTFEDKHSLFITALQRYLDCHYQEIEVIIRQAASSQLGFNHAMHQCLDLSFDDDFRTACLAINTINERSHFDNNAREILTEHVAQLLNLFDNKLKKVVEQETLTLPVPIPRICQLLLIFNTGLITNAKCFLTQQKAHQLLEDQLMSLGLSTQ